MAAQVHAGLSGIEQSLVPPLATESPYGEVDAQARIPNNLKDAIAALCSDQAMAEGFGQEFVRHYRCLKDSELQRFEAAEDKAEFQRREYFSRI